MVVVSAMAVAVSRMCVCGAVVMAVIVVVVMTAVVVLCVLAHGLVQNSLATGNTTPANTDVVPGLGWKARAMPTSKVSRLLGL